MKTPEITASPAYPVDGTVRLTVTTSPSVSAVYALSADDADALADALTTAAEVAAR